MSYESIDAFNSQQSAQEYPICVKLMDVINQYLPDAESKIWHRHPVWFLEGNPIVGYNKLKSCIRLMFWSGADFDEPQLKLGTGKYKDASIRYTDVGQINELDLRCWIEKSRRIQWDYGNIYKNKGKLVRLAQ